MAQSLLPPTSRDALLALVAQVMTRPEAHARGSLHELLTRLEIPFDSCVAFRPWQPPVMVTRPGPDGPPHPHDAIVARAAFEERAICVTYHTVDHARAFPHDLAVMVAPLTSTGGVWAQLYVGKQQPSGYSKKEFERFRLLALLAGPLLAPELAAPKPTRAPQRDPGLTDTQSLVSLIGQPKDEIVKGLETLLNSLGLAPGWLWWPSAPEPLPLGKPPSLASVGPFVERAVASGGLYSEPGCGSASPLLLGERNLGALWTSKSGELGKEILGTVVTLLPLAIAMAEDDSKIDEGVPPSYEEWYSDALPSKDDQCMTLRWRDFRIEAGPTWLRTGDNEFPLTTGDWDRLLLLLSLMESWEEGETPARRDPSFKLVQGQSWVCWYGEAPELDFVTVAIDQMLSGRLLGGTVDAHANVALAQRWQERQSDPEGVARTLLEHLPGPYAGYLRPALIALDVAVLPNLKLLFNATPHEADPILRHLAHRLDPLTDPALPLSGVLLELGGIELALSALQESAWVEIAVKSLTDRTGAPEHFAPIQRATEKLLLAHDPRARAVSELMSQDQLERFLRERLKTEGPDALSYRETLLGWLYRCSPEAIDFDRLRHLLLDEHGLTPKERELVSLSLGQPILAAWPNLEDVLLQLADAPALGLRGWALSKLSRFELGGDVTATVEKLLDDPELTPRDLRESFESLSARPTALRKLAALSTSSDHELRATALQGLANLHLLDLRSALQDTPLRFLAEPLLRLENPPKSLVHALFERGRQPGLGEKVIAPAAAALGRLGWSGGEVQEELERLARPKWYYPNVEAAVALLRMGRKEYAEPLLTLLLEGDPWETKIAQARLGELEGEPLEIIRSMVEERASEEQSAAFAEAVARAEHRRWVERLDIDKLTRRPASSENVEVLAEWLSTPGWETWGIDNELVPDRIRDNFNQAWRALASVAGEELLKEALTWPNSMAVVQSAGELHRRGVAPETFMPVLLAAAENGRWHIDAGLLLGEMGEGSSAWDDDLFALLREGRPAAVLALTARHPEQVFTTLLQLEDAITPEEWSRLLFLACPPALDHLIKALQGEPSPSRFACQQALLEFSSEALMSLELQQVSFGSGVEPKLAAALGFHDPRGLAAWAAREPVMAFAAAASAVRAHGQPVVPQVQDVQLDPADFFLRFVSNVPVPPSIILDGLDERNPESVVWVCLRSLTPDQPDQLIEAALPSLLKLRDHPHELIWKLTLEILVALDPELATREATRLSQFRDLLSQQHVWARQYEIQQLCRKLLREEFESAYPSRLTLMAGLELVTRYRGLNGTAGASWFEDARPIIEALELPIDDLLERERADRAAQRAHQPVDDDRVWISPQTLLHRRLC